MKRTAVVLGVAAAFALAPSVAAGGTSRTTVAPQVRTQVVQTQVYRSQVVRSQVVRSQVVRSQVVRSQVVRQVVRPGAVRFAFRYASAQLLR